MAIQKSVLVVDDDPQIRDLLQRALTKVGYEVALAADGRQAISMLEESDYDVVIADILMPERDGLEVVMYLQRERPKTPSIVISSPSNRVFLQSAELLGATRVVEKPFELEDITRAIEEVLAPGGPPSD